MWGSNTSSRYVILLMCILASVTTTTSMMCYRCTISPPQYIGDADQPCSKFDGSSKFYNNCPSSTFCVKRVIHYLLPNGTKITTAERNCASQKYEYQDYNKNNREWKSKQVIDGQIYKEGCFVGEDRGAPNGPSEYCYCSSNYCNKAPSMTKLLQNYHFLIFIFLRIFFIFYYKT